MHLRTAIAAAVLVTAGMTSISAMAAAPSAQERVEIQQTYRAERGACLDGTSTQEKGACLAEATAARGEALRGELGMQTVASNERALPVEADLVANALSRCDPVPVDARSSCERRVLGDHVIVVGSVAEGGIIRELPAGEAVVVGQTDSGLPVIVAEATEPLMEAAPAGEPFYGTNEPTADSQGFAQAEVILGDATVSREEPLELVTEPRTAQALQDVLDMQEKQEQQEQQEIPMMQEPQDLQVLPEVQELQPAQQLAAAPATNTQDGVTSSQESGAYPTWLQPQRFE